MNNLAKLLAAIGLLLIGIAATVYVFNDIAEKRQKEEALSEIFDIFKTDK